MRQLFDFIITYRDWIAIEALGFFLGLSLSLLFMHRIPNKRQRICLRILFWSILILVPFIIVWKTGEYSRVGGMVTSACVMVLIALKDSNLKRAEIRRKSKEHSTEID